MNKGYICIITNPMVNNNLCKIISVSCQDIIDKNVEHILIFGNCTFDYIYSVDNINIIYAAIIIYLANESEYFQNIMLDFESILRRNRIRYRIKNKEQIDKFFQILIKINQEKNIQN